MQWFWCCFIWECLVRIIIIILVSLVINAFTFSAYSCLQCTEDRPLLCPLHEMMALMHWMMMKHHGENGRVGNISVGPYVSTSNGVICSAHKMQLMVTIIWGYCNLRSVVAPPVSVVGPMVFHMALGLCTIQLLTYTVTT